MTAASVVGSGVATNVASPAVPTPRRWLRPRLLWLVPGLAIGYHASGLAEHVPLGLVALLLFGIAPHATVLLGLVQPHAPGRLAPRAVPWFDLAHHPLLPMLLIAVGASGIVSPVWTLGGMAWLSHIVVDWALGSGSRRHE